MWYSSFFALTLTLLSAVSLPAGDSHSRGSGNGASAAVPADSVRIPVLVYHSVLPHHPGQTKAQRDMAVDPVAFEAQMQLLRACGVRVIPLDTLVDVLNGHASAPANAAVVTFDDGWENVYRHAFPVLKRLGIPATFFVFTSPIGRDDRFVTWEQLREMRNAGMSIESHSRTHPLMTHDGPALMKELVRSRDDIANHLGTTPKYFAYPFGKRNAEVIAAVQQAGYSAARGFGGGAWNATKSLWNMRSVVVTDNMNAFRRALQLPDGGPPGCSPASKPRAPQQPTRRPVPGARIGA